MFMIEDKEFNSLEEAIEYQKLYGGIIKEISPHR